MPIVLCTYKSCSKRGNWVITIYTLTSLSNGKRGNVRLIYAKSANIQKVSKTGTSRKIALAQKSQKTGTSRKITLHRRLRKLGQHKKSFLHCLKSGGYYKPQKGGNREKCSKPAKIRITRPQKRRFSREILYISEISKYCHIKPQKNRGCHKSNVNQWK